VLIVVKMCSSATNVGKYTFCYITVSNTVKCQSLGTVLAWPLHQKSAQNTSHYQCRKGWTSWTRWLPLPVFLAKENGWRKIISFHPMYVVHPACPSVSLSVRLSIHPSIRRAPYLRM
jgi:hypothetical protein